MLTSGDHFAVATERRTLKPENRGLHLRSGPLKHRGRTTPTVGGLQRTVGSAAG